MRADRTHEHIAQAIRQIIDAGMDPVEAPGRFSSQLADSMPSEKRFFRDAIVAAAAAPMFRKYWQNRNAAGGSLRGLQQWLEFERGVHPDVAETVERIWTNILEPSANHRRAKKMKVAPVPLHRAGVSSRTPHAKNDFSTRRRSPKLFTLLIASSAFTLSITLFFVLWPEGKPLSFDEYYYRLDSVQWRAIFGGAEIDAAAAIAVTSNGSYLVAGGTRDRTTDFSEGPDQAWLIKIAGEGNEEWRQALKGDGVVFSLATNDDGSAVVAGQVRNQGNSAPDMWLAKVSAEGQIVWERTYGGPTYDSADAVITSPGGGYLLAGRKGKQGTDQTEVWLVRVNEEGHFVWQRTFEFTKRANSALGSIDVLATLDGGYIVAADDGTRAIAHFKINSEGALIWERTIRYGPHISLSDLSVANDGGYVMAAIIWPDDSDTWLLKFNAQGEEVWRSTLGGPGSDSAQKILPATSGDGYFVAGHFDEGRGTPRRMFVARVDEMGEGVWRHAIAVPDSILTAAAAAVATSDGDYVVAGSTADTDDGLDMILIKLDESGRVKSTANK